MTQEVLFDKIREFCRTSEYGRLPAEEAVLPELAGTKFYEDDILIGIADADDSLFKEFKKPGIVNPEHKLPSEWLPGARSVLSIFLPYEHDIVKKNAEDPKPATPVWLHARIEGQLMLDELCKYTVKLIEENGYKAVCPAINADFKKYQNFTSNWSERHAAYAAGLGTFGLNKGLITEKGCAGRFCSIITDMPLTVTVRPYSDPFEYCTMCGACAEKCLSNAIIPEEGVITGKHKEICAPFVFATFQEPAGPHNRKRYGCAKCMSEVPCSYTIPGK